MRKFVSATLAVGIMTAGVAHAGSASATFAVTATVASTCSASATALAFGSYTPGGGAIAGTSVVSVNCTKGTPYTVGLNGGATTGGTVAQRLLASGTNTLQYNLYADNGHTTVWGNTTGSWQSGTGAGVATPNALTVYGQIPDSATNQAATPATTYADTITVTVSY